MTAITAPAPAPAPDAAPARARGRVAWRIIASVATIAALAWGTLNVVVTIAHGERHFARSFPAGGITRVEVSTDRGTVRVLASDRDDISLRAYVSDGLGGTNHRERMRGDRLVVDASCSFPVSYWCTASYTLRVPRDVEVVAWSGGGSVTVRGVTGPVELSSQHGDVDATLLRAPRARATADHGSVQLAFAAPPRRVEASSDHGDVTVVVPRTSAGYRLELSTDHGGTDVGVRTDPDSPRVIDLSSDHGDLTVRYGPGR